MPKSGAWSIRAIAFSAGRLTATNDARVDIFVSDDLHKKATRIVEGFDPDWSPNGSRIVFANGDRGRKSEIYTVNLDGSAKRQLTQEKGGTGACMPAWSPDRKTIAFAITGPDLHKAGIYVMGEDGSNVQFVTEGLGPGWSPDGHRLVFYRLSKSRRDRSSIWVANADGTETKEITDQNSMSWFPRWTQDGKIVFASDRDGRSAIYLLNSDGSHLQRLVYSKDSDFFSPEVSPDNKQLVVAQLSESRPREYTKPTILVIELDRSPRTRPIAEGTHPSVLWVKN